MLSKAERTRQFIIEQTAPVFNKKGYAGTSLNDIIEVTGLTKGSIYGNFANKDEVAVAVFEYNFGLVVKYLSEKIKVKESAIDKLMVYPETYRNYLKIPFLKSGCPLLNTSTEVDDTHELLKAKVVKALAFWKNNIEKIIEYGKERGEIKKKVNASEFAYQLMSLIEGAIMQAKATNKPAALKSSMDLLEKLISEMKN